MNLLYGSRVLTNSGGKVDEYDIGSKRKSQHNLKFRFTVPASGNNLIDFGFSSKLLAIDTNDFHEFDILWFAAHLR